MTPRTSSSYLRVLPQLLWWALLGWVFLLAFRPLVDPVWFEHVRAGEWVQRHAFGMSSLGASGDVSPFHTGWLGRLIVLGLYQRGGAHALLAFRVLLLIGAFAWAWRLFRDSVPTDAVEDESVLLMERAPCLIPQYPLPGTHCHNARTMPASAIGVSGGKHNGIQPLR